MADPSEHKFFLSGGAYDALRSAGGGHPNVTLDRSEADRIIVMTTDLGKWFGIRRGVMDIVSGSFEVYLDYYPSWRGDPKVYAVDPESAEKIWFKPPVPDEAVE